MGMEKERPSNSFRHKASNAHRIIEISCTHLKKGGILLLLVPTCPDNNMNTTMILGPIVNAASVDGHKLPIVSPNAELVSVCKAKAPKNRANLLPSLCSPAIGYKIHPKMTGKNASIGSSPKTLLRTYALVLYKLLVLSRPTTARSLVNKFKVLTMAIMAVLMQVCINTAERSAIPSSFLSN